MYSLFLFVMFLVILVLGVFGIVKKKPRYEYVAIGLFSFLIILMFVMGDALNRI